MATVRELFQEVNTLPDARQVAPITRTPRDLLTEVSALPQQEQDSGAGQKLGFLARGLVKGPLTAITGLADLAANAAGSGINFLLDQAGSDMRVPRDDLTGLVSRGLVRVENGLGGVLGGNPMPDAPTNGVEAFLEGVGEATTAGAIPLAGLITRGGSLAARTAAPAATAAGRAVDDLAGLSFARPGVTASGEATAGAASVPGAELGGDLAADILGEDFRGAGQTAGGLAGSFAPAAAGAGLNRAAQLTLGQRGVEGIPGVREPRPGSLESFEAAERSGVQPSLGLVGNKGAKFIENTTGAVPLVGSRTQAVQLQQADQAGERLRATAADIRPPGTERTLDSTDIGANLVDFGGRRFNEIKAKVSGLENQLTEAIGPRTPVPISRTLQRIRDLKSSTTSAQHPTLDQEISTLITDAAPIDQALGQQLNARRQAAQDQLDSLAASGASTQQQARLSKTIRDLDGEIEDNLGVPYEVARDWRSSVGVRTNQGGIPGGQLSRIYEAHTRDLEGVAAQAGVGSEFKQVMAVERQLNATGADAALAQGGDLPFLKKLSSQESGQAFDAIVKGGERNFERLQLLKQNMRVEEWQRTVGDVIERLGVATPGQPNLGKAFSPDVFLTNWNRLADRSKDILLSDFPAARRQLDDLAKVSLAMKQRGKASNPSGTATTAITAGAGAGLVGAPLQTAAALGAGVAVTEAVVSRQLAAAVAGVNPDLAERVLRRLPGEAGREGQRTAADQQSGFQ